MTPPALWTKHRPLARSIANQFWIPGMDRDDVQQEALIGLWEASRRWDPARGPFAPYARVVVTRRLQTAVRVGLQLKHRPLTFADREGLDHAATVPGPHRDAEAKETLLTILDRLPRMSVLEQRALVGFAVGATYEEIADAAGCDAKAVDNAYQRARAKAAA